VVLVPPDLDEDSFLVVLESQKKRVLEAAGFAAETAARMDWR